MLQVHDGRLYVNGVAREEPFIYQQPAYTLGKLVVPPGDVSLCHTAARIPTLGICLVLGYGMLEQICQLHALQWCFPLAHTHTHTLPTFACMASAPCVSA
jgi:hypothetical protein